MQVLNQVASTAAPTVLDKGDVVPSTGEDEGTGVNGNIVLFSDAVLTCDVIGLCTFMVNTKQEAVAVAQRSSDLEGDSASKKSSINWATALLHTGAYTIRSTVTTTTAILLLVIPVFPEAYSMIDAS